MELNLLCAWNVLKLSLLGVDLVVSLGALIRYIEFGKVVLVHMCNNKADFHTIQYKRSYNLRNEIFIKKVLKEKQMYTANKQPKQNVLNFFYHKIFINNFT